jgi:hypothetical protein
MGGVGVIVGKCGRYFASIEARIAVNGAPDWYPCIASRATSRQTPQPMPCGSHAVTRPRSSRAETKQSSLCLWPRFSQPQKHGMWLNTSG